MPLDPRKLMLASTIAVALSSGGVVSAATPVQEVVDARQESQIWTTFALNPYLRAQEVRVFVKDGKVTLTGIVGEDANKVLANAIALGVKGVREVDNQIVVKADYMPASPIGERSYAEVVDDATVTAAVRSRLKWSKVTDRTSMDVDTTSGKVTLRGMTESVEAMDVAHRLALNTRGVIAVDNQLVLASTSKPADPVTRGSLGRARETTDAWITNKVKSTYWYSSNVDGSAISVSTDAGFVTLSGQVRSGLEREFAIELARNVRGVKEVASKGLTF